MANTILTPTAVTREAQRVLHQKLNFIGSINKQYDDSFAQDGAKIGSSLKIREPNKYTVRDGINMASQDTNETSTTLTVSSVKGVDLNFTSQELTLSIDDFSKRIIQPAMSVLAANIEADAMNMYKDVYQQVNNQGAAGTFAKLLQGRKMLQDSLAPGSGRTANLNTQDNVDLVDALKGLFNPQDNVQRQFKEGFMGRTAGFDFMENTLWPSHTVGDWAGTVTTNGAGQTGATLNVKGFTAASQVLKKGDVFTIGGVFRVHPETRQSTGVLQQFTLTADATTVAGTPVTASLPISPAIVTSGALQNVNAAPADGAAITKAGTSSTAHGISMLYQEDAFTFATADLPLPKGVDFAAREVMDGISMSLVRDFTIADRSFPCRIDVLYGYKTLRPELAARFANN